jgi:hypothetical protein
MPNRSMRWRTKLSCKKRRGILPVAARLLTFEGTSVEWVVYDNEAHGFMSEKNHYDFYDRVAKFLAQHLGSN